MNILDKLKEFFRSIGKKNKPLLLEKAKVKEKSELSIRDKYKVKQVPNLREPSFEESIEEFINQYQIQDKMSPQNINNAYRAYRRMFCNQEEDMENNFENQQKLDKTVKKLGYEAGYQYHNGKASFRHISGKIGLDEYKNRDMEKIYINCERKNIALLAKEVFLGIKDIVGDKMQMKFVSEQILEEDRKKEEQRIIKNYQRNEKIVIYAENHEIAERIAQRINEIRSRNPELFSSQKTLPFIPKKLGIMGIVSKRQTDFARTPVGIAAGKTYNDYISDLIYKCIITGFDEELELDSQAHQDNLEERMSTYANIYQDMEEGQKARIMRNIKRTFEQVCRESNVNTVYSSRMQSERQGNKEQEFEGYIDI